MKFIKYVLITIMFYAGVAFAEDLSYLSCQQIQNGIEWSYDFSNLPKKVVAGSTINISSHLKINSPELFKETLFISFNSAFKSSQELSFQVNSYHNVRLTEDLLGETIDTSFAYHFHEGTEGLFQLEPITITFISKAYQSTKCVLNKFIFNLVVENEHQVDMNPPQITAINLKRDTSSGHWLLALDIDDVSAVRLFEPNDDFVPHFTLKNIDTLEEHLCFNRNLRLVQDSYVVDLFISRTNDSLIHLPAGNYRLLGFNRSDIFGNFQYDVANELNFTATDSFYCRDQE